MFGTAVVTGMILAAGCARLGDPDARIVTGVVENDTGQTVSGAVVRLQGAQASTVSSDEGHFRLAARSDSGAKYVTAWKAGYYNGGALLAAGDASYRIQLKLLPPGDNTAYRWIPPRKPTGGALVEGAGKPCDTCHVVGDFPVVGEWESSAHARSAANPFFLAFFNGDRSAIPLVAHLGYKLDFPRSSGNCATCHVPALALKNPFDADPNRAAGVEREGVFCDFCHKVRDVALDAGGGRPGVLSMTFARPPQGEQLFFGPFDDVFPGPDTFHPLYKESRYCAACHNSRFWNVEAYSEFSEWSASSYAKQGIHCQNCHMKPDGRTRRVALASKGAIVRDPKTVASHAFSAGKDAQFMRAAVELSVRGERSGEALNVIASVKNVGAGHHLPSGSPMRNMLLVVDARDAQRGRLELLQGGRLPVWAGTGSESSGNYAGLPGKGYAKVLKDLVLYPADRRLSPSLAPLYPAPHWRPVVLESDNRIAAGAEDASSYRFRLPPSTQGPVRVTVRLLHRKTFRNWLDSQAPANGDLLLAEATLAL